MEQELYKVEIGKDYPFPIVDVEESRKAASDQVYQFKKTEAVKTEGQRILKKHVNTSKQLAKTNAKQLAIIDLFNNDNPQ